MFSDNPLVNRRYMALYKFFLFAYFMILTTINGIDCETLQIRSVQAINYLQNLKIEAANSEEKSPQ